MSSTLLQRGDGTQIRDDGLEKHCKKSPSLWGMDHGVANEQESFPGLRAECPLHVIGSSMWGFRGGQAIYDL